MHHNRRRTLRHNQKTVNRRIERIHIIHLKTKETRAEKAQRDSQRKRNERTAAAVNSPTPRAATNDDVSMRKSVAATQK